MAHTTDHAVLLYDGVCGLCNRTVRFTARRDTHRRIKFAPLQSEVGRALMLKQGLDPEVIDTMVLISCGHAFIRSDAAIAILRRLRKPWPMLCAMILIPRPIRDWVYRSIARSRYRWFGRTDTCTMPGADLQDRFLADSLT